MEQPWRNLRKTDAVTDVTYPFVIGVARARVTVQRNDLSHPSQTLGSWPILEVIGP